MHRILEIFYKLFGRITKDKIKHYIKTRLIYYVIAFLILVIGGVKALVITTFIVLSFFVGWISSKMITAFKDYRLTQRLNRIHFTAIEFDQLKRERDLAIEAFKAMSERAKSSASRPKGSMPGSSAPNGSRLNEMDIRNYMAQHGIELET